MRCSACGQVMCWLVLLPLLVMAIHSVLDFALLCHFLCYLQKRGELRDSDCMSVFLSVCSFVCACGYMCTYVCMDNDMPAH